MRSCSYLSLASVKRVILEAYIVLFPIMPLIWLFLYWLTSSFCLFYSESTSSFFLVFISMDYFLFFSIVSLLTFDCYLSLFLSLILDVNKSSYALLDFYLISCINLSCLYLSCFSYYSLWFCNCFSKDNLSVFKLSWIVRCCFIRLYWSRVRYLL